MSKVPYFQFPLSVLAFPATEYERLEAIISRGFIEAGMKLLKKLSVEEQQQFFAAKQRADAVPQGFNYEEMSHRGAVYGAAALNITMGGLTAAIKRYRALDNHTFAFAHKHGRDPYVRMKTGWLFKSRDAKGITYREFSVLCAIYSIIGDKQMARITRNRIRHCALGYRTAAIMKAELAKRIDKAQPLTEGQLRGTIARLHRNRFFARCTVGRRITYYSIRLDDAALREKVIDRHTYPDAFRTSQAAKDQMMTEEIKRRRSKAETAAGHPPEAAARFRWKPPSHSE